MDRWRGRSVRLAFKVNNYYGKYTPINEPYMKIGVPSAILYSQGCFLSVQVAKSMTLFKSSFIRISINIRNIYIKFAKCKLLQCRCNLNYDRFVRDRVIRVLFLPAVGSNHARDIGSFHVRQLFSYLTEHRQPRAFPIPPFPNWHSKYYLQKLK